MKIEPREYEEYRHWAEELAKSKQYEEPEDE